jgi:outer membrane lipoprotein-sorting protein
MKTVQIVIFSIFLACTAFADSSGKSLNTAAAIEQIKKTISRYQEVEAVEIIIKKIVTLSLLGETTESYGQLWFSKGNMRLQIDKPEPSLIVMAKNVIWVETPTPKELGGRTQVLKIKSKELNKQSKAPLAALFSDTKTWDQLKVVKQSAKENLTNIELKPLKPELFGDIVAVKLLIDTKKNELNMLAYNDELDNETSYYFSKTDFSAKKLGKNFAYTPPKGAEVTEY